MVHGILPYFRKPLILDKAWVSFRTEFERVTSRSWIMKGFGWHTHQENVHQCVLPRNLVLWLVWKGMGQEFCVVILFFLPHSDFFHVLGGMHDPTEHSLSVVALFVKALHCLINIESSCVHHNHFSVVGVHFHTFHSMYFVQVLTVFPYLWGLYVCVLRIVWK